MSHLSDQQKIRFARNRITAHRQSARAISITFALISSSAFGLLSATVALSQEPSAPADANRNQPATTPPLALKSFGEAEVAGLRTETLERLKAADPTAAASAATAPPRATGSQATGAPVTAPDATPLTPASIDRVLKKPLPGLLADRLRWLDEFEAASTALQKATHPEPSPEQQAAEAKTELDRLQTLLAQANQSPDSLLPALFRNKTSKVTAALASEMKDAIETTTNEWKEWKAKLETLQSEVEKTNTLKSPQRAERDVLFQRVTALAAKSREFQSAVTDAQTIEDRRLANERLTNFEWEWRVEALRLKVAEARLALETKLAAVRDLKLEICRTHLHLAAKLLEPMQARYRAVADDQERDLNLAKTKEENKARSSDDPIERFRARSAAELLALETLVMRSEQALVMSPRPSYEEQKTLADRADVDFANIKELLDDGKVSRLDAVRLNNEFRRIGPERDRLLKNEMAAVESQLQYYEETLTSVELELLQDSLRDRFEHDLMRERLPKERTAEGEALVNELVRKHWQLLKRRQRALEKLTENASHTLVQVTRRLAILDQEYGFIRTNIFWVRDQEPVGVLTLTQGARELNVLLKGLVRLMRETVNPKLWGQPSGEFLFAVTGIFLVPLALLRLRRVLGNRIKRGHSSLSA
jgi:potassium efflux system protein